VKTAITVICSNYCKVLQQSIIRRKNNVSHNVYNQMFGKTRKRIIRIKNSKRKSKFEYDVLLYENQK